MAGKEGAKYRVGKSLKLLCGKGGDSYLGGEAGRKSFGEGGDSYWVARKVIATWWQG